MGESSGKAQVGLKSGAGAERAVAPQATQLYVPASRNAWRFRRMGRIGPLRSTLDGECSAGSWSAVSDLGHRGKTPRAQGQPHPTPGSPSSTPCLTEPSPESGGDRRPHRVFSACSRSGVPAAVGVRGEAACHPDPAALCGSV